MVEREEEEPQYKKHCRGTILPIWVVAGTKVTEKKSMRNLALGSLLELEDTEWIANGQEGHMKSSASDVEFEKYMKIIQAKTDSKQSYIKKR